MKCFGSFQLLAAVFGSRSGPGSVFDSDGEPDHETVTPGSDHESGDDTSKLSSEEVLVQKSNKFFGEPLFSDRFAGPGEEGIPIICRDPIRYTDNHACDLTALFSDDEIENLLKMKVLRRRDEFAWMQNGSTLPGVTLLNIPKSNGYNCVSQTKIPFFNVAEHLGGITNIIVEKLYNSTLDKKIYLYQVVFSQ